MHADRIDIFNEAYGDHLTVCISYYFQFKLLPAKNGFLNQNLSYEGCLKTSCTYGSQLVLVVYKAAACAAHGVRGTKHDRISESICNGKRLFHRVSYIGERHTDAKRIHGLLELDSVFASLDGVHLNADYLHLIFVQNAFLVQLRAEVQSRLSSKVGKQRVRSLLCDNPLQAGYIKGLNVSHICSLGICHDGCRV